MAIFKRRESPPDYPELRRFTPHLRRDFVFQCAYCERTESYFGGQEIFEIDHFRPASKFPELSRSYENLYYVCSKCNRHKSDTWPSEAAASRGERFADPCVEDPYLDHLRESESGGLEELTRCGRYSNDHIRLSREELRNWRLARKQARADLPVWLQMENELMKLLPTSPGAAEQLEIRAMLAAVARRIEETRARFSVS
jgi:hypothetical protein